MKKISDPAYRKWLGFGPGKKPSLTLTILAHVLAWSLFFLLPMIFYPIRFSNNRFLAAELLSKIVPVGFFYLNYFWLLPAFFEKKKYLTYGTGVLLSLAIIITQTYFFRKKMAEPFLLNTFPARGIVLNNRGPVHPEPESDAPDSGFRPMPAPPGQGAGFPPGRGLLMATISRSISLWLFLLLSGSLIRLGFSYVKNLNEKKALENANLNAEVNFLKSQINPHFLFNTLNSIYSLAHDKSEHTENAILRLSELFRYVIYDSGAPTVELEKDLGYISNYIDLQRIRLSSKVDIIYSVKGASENLQIAPLLLIVFVENAFKHGVSYTSPSTISVEIGIFEKTLTLSVKNMVAEKNTFTSGGVGLKNVKRRLDLLYPGQHALDIFFVGRLHVVNLKIDLEN